MPTTVLPQAADGPGSAAPDGQPRSRRGALVVGGIILAVTLALGAVLVGAQLPSGGLPQNPVGTAAPELELTTLEGEPVVLSDLRGGPVLLTFWASWCSSCKDDMPQLRRLQRTWAPAGVQVLGVVIDDRHEDALATAAAYEHTYPSLFDADDVAARAYAVSGTPETFLIDRDGTIAAKWIGPLPEHDVEFQLAVATG
jgi:cytochrome c biogenesis protein CcmG, thiol:disulfide interchange protein DsbE